MPTSLAKYEYHEGEPQQVQWWVHDSETDTGAWVAVPGLRCNTLRMPISNNGISTAQLEYEYGRIDRGEGNGWETVPPLSSTGSILHRFVRVMLFNSGSGEFEPLWVGVITQFADDDLKQPRSPATDEDTVDTFGRQVIQAAGPEWILQRTQIETSYQKSATATPDLVLRGLPFNVRTGRLQKGNASQEGNKDSSDNLFARSAASSAPWTGEDIADYMFARSMPDRFQSDLVTLAATPEMTWTVSNQSILAATIPQVQSHARSIYDILNDLADPRRFLSWSTQYTEGANDATFGTFAVTFNSASSQLITLNGGNIAANTRTVTLNTSGEVDGNLSLATDAQRLYSAVIVQGARRGYVLTTQVFAGEYLKEGWSSQDEAAYVSAVVAAEEDEQELLYKLQWAKYPDVFTRFTCPFDADFSGFVLPGDAVHVPGLRWERNTPLKKGWDYTGLTPVQSAGARANPEFERMFAVYKLPDPLESTTRYSRGDKIQFNEAIGGKAIYGQVVPRPLDDEFGVELRPTRSAHWHASDTAVPDVEDEDQPFNYKTDAWVTGYLQVDEYVEGYAGNAEVIGTASRLVIQLGDVAFYDTLEPNTIVGVSSDGLLEQSPGTPVVLRDDRDLLNDIAELAYRWYATQRFAYRVRYAHIARDVEPGMIATNVDGASNDSIITEVAYDFDNHQTNIATAYAEPDFNLLAKESLFAPPARTTQIVRATPEPTRFIHPIVRMGGRGG